MSPRTHIASVQARARRPKRSDTVARWFLWYVRRFAKRHFHAVRIARSGLLSPIPDGPLIVVLNHPAWWDPLVGLLASELIVGRKPFAPIDARSLARYPLLDRVGLFGIEPGTPRGAAEFLRVGRAVLADPGAALWVTAQGRFTDCRERPVLLAPGVGHLAHRLGAGQILTLAIEYNFWDEREPEALLRFGPPLPINGPGSPREWTRRIAQSLESNLDCLARDAITRDPGRFVTLLGGRSGVGGIYDFGCKLRTAWRGMAPRPEDGAEGAT